MALPIVFIVSTAFKPLNELFLFPPAFLVKHPTLYNFEVLFLHTASGVVPFVRYLFNSVAVVALALSAVILTSAMAGYVLSKKTFHFKQTILSLIVIALMFAPETVAIPRYLIVTYLGLVNTYWGHVLPFLASTIAVFLIKQFIDQIPDEILDAARIDGTSEWSLFLRIVMPLSTPAVATVAILTFQTVWMDQEASTLYMTKETMKTVAYYVTTLTNGLHNVVAGQSIAAAAGLLVFVPNLLIFLMFQKRIIETMVHSGVK